MTITVIKGGQPLTVDERNKIRAIFHESNCPNESLKNSIKGFVSFDGQVLHINHAVGDRYGYPEELSI